MTKDRKVYFAWAENTNHIKIGSTTFPVQVRLSSIQTGCPYKLKVLLVIPNGSYELERVFQKRFARYRTLNEWFQYEPEISTFIKGILEDRFEKEAELYWEKQAQDYWDEQYDKWEKEQDAQANS